MEIELLRYFVVTAEMEHVTNAANALHITQPSLSSAIKRLETSVGLPLFEKDGRGVKLTDCGRNYYRKVKAALELIDEANSEIAKVQQDMERSLTILAPSLFGFPGLIDEILRDHPNLQFSHVGLSHTDLIRNLKEQKLDFAICWAAQFDPALSYEVLMVQELCVCVGPQNRYYDKEEITLEELNTFPFICSRAGEAKMDYLAFIMEQHGIAPPSISHATSAKDEVSAIENSSFASLQPADVSQVYKDKKIHILRIRDVSPIYANLYLVYNKEKQRPISKGVCRLILNHFKNAP